MKRQIEIIPAIDVIEGRCVRLTRGDYRSRKVYHDDPLHVARQFEQAGIVRLHLVDLDGAKARHIVNHRVLEKIASQTGLRIDFGGGVQSDHDIELAFACGASQVTGGSIAIKNRPLFLKWLDKYGSERIILGADSRDGMVAIHGWQETAETEVHEFLATYQALGVRQAICTDVASDGAMAGPAFSLYRRIRAQLPDLQIVASGGVASLDDIVRLDEMDLHGVIIGKAIYEGKIGLETLAEIIGGE